jgi:hypothetical protein
MQFSYSRNVQGKQMKPWQGILFGLIFAIVGIGLIAYSVVTIQNYNKKNETYIETTSKVVDYDYDSDGLQAIIVEYTVDGKTYRKTSNSYSNMPKSIGTEVSVKYNPDNPSDAIWTTDSTNIVMPLAGALFTIVGIIVVISSAKKMKQENNQPVVESSNGLYNSVDTMNNLAQNNLNTNQQQTPQINSNQVQQTTNGLNNNFGQQTSVNTQNNLPNNQQNSNNINNF